MHFIPLELNEMLIIGSSSCDRAFEFSTVKLQLLLIALMQSDAVCTGT